MKHSRISFHWFRLVSIFMLGVMIGMPAAGVGAAQPQANSDDRNIHVGHEDPGILFDKNPFVVATTGTLQGTVTDAATTLPISGALVDAGGGLSATTDGAGSYQIPNVPAGSYTVTASATRYTSSTVAGVSVTAGGTTTQNFALTPVVKTVSLQGTVTDANTSAPITGALVYAGGNHSGYTNAIGFYRIATMPAGSYTVTASATGYISSTVTGVVITPGEITTQNFALTPVATGCTTNCLRVTAILLQTNSTGVQGRVTIHNEAGVAVSGAAISVHWDLPGGGAMDQTKNTSSTGNASFNLTGGAGTYTITVTNVTKTGSAFDPAGSTILTKSITK